MRGHWVAAMAVAMLLACGGQAGGGDSGTDGGLGSRMGNGGILIGRYAGRLSTHTLGPMRQSCSPYPSDEIADATLVVSRVDGGRVRAAITPADPRGDSGVMAGPCEAVLRADINEAFAVDQTVRCTISGMALTFVAGRARGEHTLGSNMTVELESIDQCVHFIGQAQP